MKPALILAQITTGVLLTVLVLMQPQGVGLGRSFGSQSYHSKRGIEHLIFRLTIILATLFVIISLATLFVP